jgi:hypothetical protein
MEIMETEGVNMGREIRITGTGVRSRRLQPRNSGIESPIIQQIEIANT